MSNETTERKPDVVTITVTLTVGQGAVQCNIVGTMNDNASKTTSVIAKTMTLSIQDTAKSTLEDIKALFEFAKEVAAKGEVTNE